MKGESPTLILYVHFQIGIIFQLSVINSQIEYFRQQIDKIFCRLGIAFSIQIEHDLLLKEHL